MRTRRHAAAFTLSILTALCAPALATKAADAAQPVSLEMNTLAADGVDAQVLDRIVQPIVTVVDHVDGLRSVSVGSGFVVGRHFYTVQHNIESAPHARRTITIDGVSVEPAFSDRKYDLAVFLLPDELCARMCNRLRFAPMPAMEELRHVYWLRKFRGEHVMKRGAVVSYAVFGEAPASADEAMSCQQQLVVEVDVPFVSGTSGSPVVHTDTGAIVGIVQGSFESAGQRTGYFMPVNCMRQLTGSLTSDLL